MSQVINKATVCVPTFIKQHSFSKFIDALSSAKDVEARMTKEQPIVTYLKAISVSYYRAP